MKRSLNGTIVALFVSPIPFVLWFGAGDAYRWLLDAINGNEIVVASAAVQAVFAAALTAWTIYYAGETKTIAVDTAAMARATEEMAKGQIIDRQKASRPVIIFRLKLNPTLSIFRVEVVNAGVGPALDLFVVTNPMQVRFRSRGQSRPQPFSIAAGEEYSLLRSRPEKADC